MNQDMSVFCEAVFQPTTDHLKVVLPTPFYRKERITRIKELPNQSILYNTVCIALVSLGI